MARFYHYLMIALITTSACKQKNSQEPVEEPGQDKTAKTKTLETGADLLQKKSPLSAINTYLNGFHFYSGNINGQMEAFHYCAKLNEDITQCVIYDSDEKDSHLMGVEYIISEKIFKNLPAEEKALWHSHAYEVKSGTLVAPGIPDIAEHELMEQIVSTYGKTWHTWHTDLDKALPYGSPQLMMGFTKDGQLNDTLLNNRDKRLDISTTETKQNRSDITAPTKVEGADQWEKGKSIQLPSLGKTHQH